MDPNFPFLGRSVQLIQDNLDSIKKFINDLKNKNFTKKLLSETININIANKYWGKDGFLIKPDRQSIGFHSTITGRFLPLGYSLDNRLGEYFMEKISPRQRQTFHMQPLPVDQSFVLKDAS